MTGMTFQWKSIGAGAAALLMSLSFAFSTSVQARKNTMISIPAGKFIMGCIPEKDSVCSYVAEEKKHTVYVNAFKIDKYEVTFARYSKCLNAGVCTPLATGGAMNFGWPGVENRPVNGVTWYQAKQFCEFEGKRLPTEAEWEKAARGPDGRTYPWGETQPSCRYAVMDRENAGHAGCGTGSTMNVGSKPRGVSPYGVHDMAGNVWEWTADWHSEQYYFNSPHKNPKGPSSGYYKVTRGGDFFSRQGYEVRSTSRFPYDPNNPSPAVGFRCAK